MIGYMWLGWHIVYVRMDDDEAEIISMARNIGFCVSC